MLRRFKIAQLLFLFFVLECTPHYQTTPHHIIPPPEEYNSRIKVRVITQDRSYPRGGPVDLKLEIENISQEVVSLDFDLNQLFDFVIYRKGGEVWRWSYDKIFDKTQLNLYIYPGEVWTFQTEWDTKDNQRRYVSGGRYYVEGILRISPVLKSEKVEIGLTD
ncbi:MAG: BsuPI-related putative proteinase inhibitor [candidate division Zixibacteria bacterium]|nr:BsuPI-related putative proteinase inhibitor [candidate division Zixibacteria bacterium]